MGFLKETSEDYARWTAPLRANPSLTNGLILANAALTAVGYIAYPLLLFLVAIFASDLLARCIAVPAVGFVLISIFRYAYNAPRPYEALNINPLMLKLTKGKSFPSRHTFCMFMIACSWFVYIPWVGMILMLSGCFMGVIRVLGGVHFPRDVIAGALCAIVLALVGYGILPTLIALF